ncbi:DUF2975 domain-containing protein [Polaribacter aestuariivivens]|uniref:DUF2975 domain-containing protein n=1 Tax=Polaribacter aestuariivivens TaxID=2304626 RepID=UPI003F496293
MKYTNLLCRFVNILYYLGLVFIFIIPFLGVYVLYQVYTDGYKSEDKIYVNIGYDYLFKIVIQYALYFLPLICVFYFRKILTLFSHVKVFHTDVIKLFNKTGRYLIIFGIAKIIIVWLPISYTFLSINGDSFTARDIHMTNFTLNFNYFIWIAIGLFFIVLSEIFKEAKELKQENDLTI